MMDFERLLELYASAMYDRSYDGSEQSLLEAEAALMAYVARLEAENKRILAAAKALGQHNLLEMDDKDVFCPHCHARMTKFEYNDLAALRQSFPHMSDCIMLEFALEVE